jgi:2-oxoisovalerate dehydrogenase E2 component (dihydrolipoyl transacylase)
MSEYQLPDVGEGLTEAEIVTWRVAVGDTVKVNDIIVDIETAKSIVELPSPFAGVVTALLVEEGQTVPVGTPIIAIGDREAADAYASAATAGDIVDEGRAAEADEGAESDEAEERQPVLVGYGPRSGSKARRRKVSAPPADVPVAEPVESTPAEERPFRPAQGAEPEPETEHSARVLAKPPVRKLAKDLGIDLAEVPSQGPIVTRADVEA